jgi:hypothetical protein
VRTRISVALAIAAIAVAVNASVAHAAAPQITDSWVTTATASAIDARALVDPEGATTTAKVEYLTEAAYLANIAGAKAPFSGATSSPVSGTSLGSGNIPVEFLRHLGGLKPSTAYRYRISATNFDGTTQGPDRRLVTTETAPVFSLPDGRGWELVSPTDKNGGSIQRPGEIFGGGLLQAAGDGNSVTYSSSSSFGVPLSASSASQYFGSRGGAGWDTANVTVPALSGTFGSKPDGVPYRLFSGDLARALVLHPQRCETPPCPRSYLLRQSANGALAASSEATDLSFAGANSELTVAVLAKEGNLYRFSGGALTAVNLKPGDPSPTPGATLGAQSGAVSSDGSRVYFQLEGNLYLRQGAQTFQVDGGLGSGEAFQVATADGATAFFTEEGHLFRYAAGGAATDLTPAGGVEGVVGISPDAAYVYYVTATGLYLRQGATTTKAADAADASNYPPATGTSRVAANGNLAFLSSVDLGEYGQNGNSEAYLYAPASKALICASCNPSGTRPLGPTEIAGALDNGSTAAYKPRALSASGWRLFFETEDNLVPTDSNNDWDVYQWEGQTIGTCQTPGGCLTLISSGRATEGANFVDASADGNDAFFLTDGSLVANDPGAVDLYDARVGGGFPVPPTPLPCIADACQVVPGEPEDPSPGTAFYKPEGNAPQAFPKKPKKPKKAKKKAKKGKGKGKKQGSGKKQGKGKAKNKRGGSK